MIVEFIGATGAGKTTLARAIAGRRIGEARVRMATDLVTDRPGRRSVTDPHVINLLADVTAFPSFLRSVRDDRDLVRFAFDRLWRHAPSTFARLNYLRNVVRKLGMHELMRRTDDGTAFLVDEGVLLIAYQLFVYSDAPFSQAEIEHFARLVPLPDRIVYVKAPLDVLRSRAMTRPDRRRELARSDPHEVERWIARAVELFDALAETEPIRARLLTVDLGDQAPDRLDAAVRQVEDPLRVAIQTSGTSDQSLARAGRGGASGKSTVIAFVGSEATGKSTILEGIERSLARNHRVRRVHAGKPPSTPITFLPHVLLPALRAVFPEQRTLRVEERYVEGDATAQLTTFPLLFGIRSVMLAYERRALLVRAARSGRDTIVLSDRYPSDTSGAPDGPQLAHLPVPPERLSIRRLLAEMERRLYHDIPAPDLVFHLSAPLEVTLQRNAARGKQEPEDYVRFRHALSSTLRFEGVPVHRLDTDRDLGVVMRDVEGVIRNGRATGG
ncbi:MAG: hypothetical protein ACRDG8_02805 [Actinomycetota bacterium]